MAKAAPAAGRRKATPRAPSAPEVVDPAWLLKAFAVMVLIALACGYASLCGLFYRGQWQLVLHPARASAAPATVDGVPYELVRFDVAGTGVPQLTGWWIPAGAGAAYAPLTILYLPSGEGSLMNARTRLKELHDVGAAIFALDYRGFGQSADVHPSQASMAEDANTAWDYLTSSRAIPGDRIIPYGVGLGGAIATGLVSAHGLVPALILDDPDFHVVNRVRADPRSRLLPVKLLLHERFNLLPALNEIRTPKLLLSRGPQEDPEVLKAADPKLTVALPPTSLQAEYLQAVRRFLDQYAPPSAMPGLVPTRAP